MINGKTKLVGVMGYPIEHSLSPAMHNAAFAVSGLEYVYVPLLVKPEFLKEAVEGLIALGFEGFNVTIPHKVAIMPYLDALDRSATLVGAVNTVVIKEGRSIGYNTDAEGFVQSLVLKNVAIAKKKAVILGAGGAARAVVCGLMAHGIENITLGARSLEKASEFVTLFPQGKNIVGRSWEDECFHERLQECDLLINSTPIGMGAMKGQQPPINWQLLNRKAVICDLIYNPPETQFLAEAIRRDHVSINGEGMLVEQGALAFKLWTGVFPEREAMYKIFTKLTC